MKNLFVIALFCLAACSKSIDKPANPAVAAHPNDIQSCKFGITEFNLVKRPAVISEDAARGKPLKLTSGTSTPSGGAVILLDFDGFTISNTVWNWAGDIITTPANLTSTQIDEIFKRVANDSALLI